MCSRLMRRRALHACSSTAPTVQAFGPVFLVDCAARRKVRTSKYGCMDALRRDCVANPVE